MSDGRVEQTWYGELYAIHKLKIAATRFVIAMDQDRRDDREITGPPLEVAGEEYRTAKQACHELGLTDEILLERLKV